MAGKILIGTASWTDPGFIAHWYPRDLPASARLPYYAEHFNFVEVNSTFYAVPESKVVERWCEQTPPDFTFDVKLHRLVSRHATPVKTLPPKLRDLAEVTGDKVQPTPKLEQALAREFLRHLQPLADSGKLGALLLQMTPAFSPRKSQLKELDPLLELLAGIPVAVELRNRGWVIGEQLQETLEFFRDRHLAFVGVDAPQTEHFMIMPPVDAVTNPQLAYLRLHGRNAEGYVSGRTVAERFNYLYSEQELKEIAARTKQLAERARKTHVVYNNNADDYALRSAAAFQKLLAREHPEVLPSATGRSKIGPAKTFELDFVPAAKQSGRGRKE